MLLVLLICTNLVSMKDKGKYRVSQQEDEAEVLPNLLNLTTKTGIDKQEAIGFAYAQAYFTEELSDKTKFDANYILNLHKVALKHLYPFAGQYRTVNISKGGFPFPPARYLDNSMKDLEQNLLKELKDSYNNPTEFIEIASKIHAELLFVHPFREGNGRTARLLTNLMSFKFGYDSFAFEKLNNEEMFSKYVVAIQQAPSMNYKPMIEILTSLFRA